METNTFLHDNYTDATNYSMSHHVCFVPNGKFLASTKKLTQENLSSLPCIIANKANYNHKLAN